MYFLWKKSLDNLNQSVIITGKYCNYIIFLLKDD